MMQLLKEHRHPYIIVLNKVDKLSQRELSEQSAKIAKSAGGGGVVQTSVETGQGIDGLRDALLSV